MDKEIETIEFKKNNSNPEKIGEHISAISNAARIKGERRGFLVWGIDNDTHEIVGTKFRYRIAKKGK